MNQNFQIMDEVPKKRKHSVTYGNVSPIKPEDCHFIEENTEIPDQVFEIFNELIKQNLERDNTATVTLKEVEAKMETLFEKDFNRKWLNVEPFYKNNGWNVTFHGPGFGDDFYPSFYVFKK